MYYVCIMCLVYKNTEKVCTCVSKYLCILKYIKFFLTLFDMGMMAPTKMFLITVLKGLGRGRLNFVTFNINPWGIKKTIFDFIGYLVLPKKRVHRGSTTDFLKLMFRKNSRFLFYRYKNKIYTI